MDGRDRQEETIIFALIERAQFPLNPEVYEKNRCVMDALHSDVDHHTLLITDWVDDSSSAAFGGLKGKYDDFDGSLLVRGVPTRSLFPSSDDTAAALTDA